MLRDTSYFFMMQPRSSGWENAKELSTDAMKQKIFIVGDKGADGLQEAGAPLVKKGETQHLFQSAG